MTLQQIEDALVWSRDNGQRIIIVIDDQYDDVLLEKAPNAHSHGLREIWLQTKEWKDILAIGFFLLPDRSDRIATVLRSIQNWVPIPNSGPSNFYFLVDVFHGFGFYNRIGLEFATQIPAEFPEAKIAFFTVGASNDIPKSVEDKNIKDFNKTTTLEHVNKHGRLPSDLLEWLDYDEHALEYLWDETALWFSDDHKIMKHNWDDIKQEEKIQYIQDVKRVLGGIDLPTSWWENQDSAKNIHESLKHLCGAEFCGQVDNGKYSLSVGAAYLIALVAHQKAWGNIEPLTKSIQSWKDYEKAASERLFPLQDRSAAKESAKALYDLFWRIFEKRGTTDQSQVKEALFDEKGQKLSIQFEWNAREQSTDRDQSLADMVSQKVDTLNISIPQLAKNTTDAVLRLWKSMLRSKWGFMITGAIYMKEDILVIRSA